MKSFAALLPDIAAKKDNDLSHDKITNELDAIIALKILTAKQEGVIEGIKQAELRHAEEIKKLESDAIKNLELTRENWIGSESLAISETIINQINQTSENIYVSIKSIITDFLLTEVSEKALIELQRKINQALIADASANIVVAGSKDLIEEIKSNLANSNISIKHTETDEEECTMETQDYIISTEIRKWISQLLNNEE